MADIWLDVVTPKDALLVSCLLPSLHKKNLSTLVTAKKQTQTVQMLRLLNVPCIEVGKYGFTLREKLVEEQKRIREFIDLFERTETPEVLWTHGGVDAIRTAFGLQIPIVYSNDTPHAIHVARLVSSLVDWLIAPRAFGRSWSKYGISKSRIVLYEGIEEVAWIKDAKPEVPQEIRQLSQGNRLILFRNIESKASYYNGAHLSTRELIRELSKMATIVYIPRYEEEKKELKNFENVWFPKDPKIAYHLIPAMDLVVGSGGTLCRESALMGVPTISFHFWDVIAKYLRKKGFPYYYSGKLNSIIRAVRGFLESPPEEREKTKPVLDSLESPVSITVTYIESTLNCRTVVN